MKSFEELWLELNKKAISNDPNSGTVALLEDGVHAIGKKIVEEASEVWMAAEHENDEALATVHAVGLHQPRHALERAQVAETRRGVRGGRLYPEPGRGGAR